MVDLIKQPNGKYCNINWDGTVAFDNCTEENIINAYIEKAKEDIKNAKNFTEIIAMAERAENMGFRRIDDAKLKEMGFDKSYNDLVKFIPRKPVHQRYASCDFATYGNCPNCNRRVRDGMGHTDKKCICGQMLKW